MLTPRQQRGLAALLETPTIQQAAARSGVSYPCLRRWLASDPEFREKYTEAMNALVTDAAAQLKKNMGEAVSTMAQIMGDQSVNAQTRLNAADSILRQGLKFVEATDILNRLQEIEERISADGVD